MENAVVLAGARTPVGAFSGSLASFTGPQLGAIAIREAIARGGLQPTGHEHPCPNGKDDGDDGVQATLLHLGVALCSSGERTKRATFLLR